MAAMAADSLSKIGGKIGERDGVGGNFGGWGADGFLLVGLVTNGPEMGWVLK